MPSNRLVEATLRRNNEQPIAASTAVLFSFLWGDKIAGPPSSHALEDTGERHRLEQAA